MSGADTSGRDEDRRLRWDAPSEAEAADMLERARELAQARADALGTPLEDRQFVVLVDEASQVLANAPAAGGGPTTSELIRRVVLAARDSRIALYEETCPACGTAPRWADDGVFGCYACSATSTSRVGTLAQMTDEQRSAAAELAATRGAEAVAALIREAEQPLGATLRLRFDPPDRAHAEIQADAEVHVLQTSPGVYLVAVHGQVAAAEGAETGWSDEHFALTRYDLTGPRPRRQISSAMSAAAGVPESAAADLAEFHRTLAAATTRWVRGVPA
ncbi:hypothetical protein, partial [Amycolatopsis sp. NPDC004378]